MGDQLNSAERVYLLQLVDTQYQNDCRDKLNLPPLEKHARFPQNDPRTCGWGTSRQPGQFVAPPGTVMATMMANTKVTEYVKTCNERRSNRASWLYPNPYNDLRVQQDPGWVLSEERLRMYLLYVNVPDLQALRAQMPTVAETPEPAITTEAPSPELPESATTLPAPPPPTRKTWPWWLGGVLLLLLLLGIWAYQYVNRAPESGPVFECEAYFWEASDTPESPDSIWSRARFDFRNLGRGAYTVEAGGLFKFNPGYTCQGRGRLANNVLEISLDQPDEQSNLHTATILAYFEPAFPVGAQHQPFWGHYLAYSSSLKRITSRPIVFVPTELATPQARQKARDFLRKLRRDSTWWRHENDY